MPFTQIMTVQADERDSLIELLENWDREERGGAPGYQRARLLADQQRPGRYVVEVDFSSEAEARENNGRAETQAWADKLRALARGEPDYDDFEVIYATR